VGTYGLESEPAPTLAAEGVTASDHSPFWNEGYAAIMASEDDEADFRSTPLRAGHGGAPGLVRRAA
jgi:hypothetical protein